MDDQLHEQINKLLLYLNTDGSTTTHPLSEEEQATEIIDVYVITHRVEESDGTPAVESTIEPSDEQGAFVTAKPIDATKRPSPHRSHPRLLLIALTLCWCTAVTVGIFSLFSLLTPTATVTIIPTTMQFTTNSAITVVTGTANPARHQVPGRQFARLSLSQARTVPTTGTGYQEASAARGQVTFYNAQPTRQVVPAGELLTGKEGVQIITDQDAVIPAAVFPTDGQVTVAAHAAIAGPGGNIPAGAVYGACCRLNVFVANRAFHGGQDARFFPMVTEQDIRGVVPGLEASLDQSAVAAFQRELHPNETLVIPAPCRSTVTPGHKAGEEATQVSVTVEETCTGEAYNTQALSDLATRIVTQDTTGQPGDGYRPTGDLQTTITQAVVNDHGGTMTLRVQIAGTWAYRFQQAQLDLIKRMIAGKSEQEATAMVVRVRGVSTVSMSIKNGTTVPIEVNSIHIVLLETL